MAKLKLAVLGTCRVHEPLKAVLRTDRIRVGGDKSFGFMHTPQEILQSMRILRRDLVPSKEIADLISLENPEEMHGSGDLFAERFGDVDAIAVEISSLRFGVYDGWYLQINRLRDRLLRAGVKGPVNYARISQGKESLPEEWEETLIRNDPFLAKVMKGRQITTMDRSNLKGAVIELLEFLGKPVVLVGHFVDTGPFKGVNPSREIIREVLMSVAQERPKTYFLDPTVHISKFGFDRALEDDSHYRSKYFVRAGDKIIRAARELLSQSAN